MDAARCDGTLRRMTGLISAVLLGLGAGLWFDWPTGYAVFIGKLAIDTWGESLEFAERTAKLEAMAQDVKFLMALEADRQGIPRDP